MNVLESILKVYPQAKDCMWGHIGVPEYTIEQTVEDDRATVTRVKRCSHCTMVIGEDDD